MTITTLVPPAVEPVGMPAARDFLRIQYDSEDDLVASLIAAARARAETIAGLCLITRTLKLDLCDWPDDAKTQGWMRLAVRPVQALVSVLADSEDITSQFVLDGVIQPSLRPVSGGWPIVSETLSITVIAGFGDAPEDVPQDLRLAVKLLASRAYHARDEAEPRSDLDEDATALLAPWRRVRL